MILAQGEAQVIEPSTKMMEATNRRSHEEDLEQPLLEMEHHDDDEELHTKTKDSPKQQQIDDAQTFSRLRKLQQEFIFHGFVIGSLAQIINVAGTTFMYYQWGEDASILTSDAGWLDVLFHTVVWVLSQVDVYLYCFMWISLTAILTRKGMSYVQRTYFSTHKGSESSTSPVCTKRAIFVLGVHFYIGVVLGVFAAWMAIDFWFGVPVPMLPMIAVLVFGLVLSYTMIWCYDMEHYGQHDINDEDNDDDDDENH